jgi:hypothetical protein
MNLFPYVVTWVPLGVIVVVLAIYYNVVAGQEDDTIHVLESDAPSVAAQVKLTRKLEMIERWGKGLTAVVVVYGLVILGIYLHFMWQQGARIPG